MLEWSINILWQEFLQIQRWILEKKIITFRDNFYLKLLGVYLRTGILTFKAGTLTINFFFFFDFLTDVKEKLNYINEKKTKQIINDDNKDLQTEENATKQCATWIVNNNKIDARRRALPAWIIAEASQFAVWHPRIFLHYNKKLQTLGNLYKISINDQGRGT